MDLTSQNQSAPDYALPPIGMIGPNDHAGVVGYLLGLADEATRARQKFEPLVDSNLTIYAFGDDPPPDDETLVLGDIQNHVLASVDIQTKEPPSVTLEPVETGEPPLVFWAGPHDVGIALGLEVFEVAEWQDEQGQLHPPLAIPEEQADLLRDLILAGQVREKWLVEVTDKLVADLYQTVFDVYWARSATDQWIRDNLLTTNIQGWTIGLYEFDPDEQKHILRDISVKNAFLDPTQTDITQMAYAGFDLPFDAGEAKKLKPHLARKIDEEARTGVPTRPDGATTWGQSWEMDFRRPMITMRIFWLRNQLVMLTPEQAVAWGAVEQRAVPVAPMTIDPSMGQGVGDENVGGDVAENADEAEQLDVPQAADQQRGVDEQASDAADDQEGAAGGDGGGAVGAVGGIQQSAAGLSAQVPLLRAAYFIPGTDTEVTPTWVDDAGGECAHPHWPCRLGIRQLTVIAGEVVDDKETEHWDIPLLHNVNVPIPGRPFGLGEPFRLKHLQRARSRVMRAGVEHSEYFRAPITAIPVSVAEALAEEYGDAHIRPDIVLKIPDDMYTALGGQIHSIIQPPQTPPALVEMQGMLKSEITEQSGRSDVLRGMAQPQVKSGKAIELLQTASASMIGFKSQRTGDVVYRLGHMMLHQLVMLPLDAIARIISKYKRHVLAAIHQRAKAIDWNLNVVVSSGNGVIQQARKREALEQFQAGAIDLETLHEALGLDHRLIMQRMESQAQSQARAQMAAGMAPAAGAQSQGQQAGGAGGAGGARGGGGPNNSPTPNQRTWQAQL